MQVVDGRVLISPIFPCLFRYHLLLFAHWRTLFALHFLLLLVLLSIATCLTATSTTLSATSTRPTATKLLEHRFFKGARKSDYVVQNLLDGLPDISEQAVIIHKKALSGSHLKPASSHRRGISGQWIFPTEEEEEEDVQDACAPSAPADGDGGETKKKGRFVLSSVDNNSVAPSAAAAQAPATAEVSGEKKKGRFIVSPAAGDAPNTVQTAATGSDTDSGSGVRKPHGGRTVGETIKTLLQKSRQHTALLQSIQQTLAQQQSVSASRCVVVRGV
jgi:hypothetical protein